MARISRWLLAVSLLIGSLVLSVSTSAAPIGNDAFQRTWARTDQPVSQLHVSRTWMWGPKANSGLLTESYAEASGGQRSVQYFDKSRMEINNPNGDQNSLWYVTNGLITKELITGQLQMGDATFQPHPPSQGNVSGDPNDGNAPTYWTFNSLLSRSPLPAGSVITQTVDRSGTVGADAGLGGYNVTAAGPVSETNHTVASVFWDFMNRSGLVYENGSNQTAPLFQNPFYATGFPISEAYWARVRVAGVEKWVLVQAFERRVLTYTPDNPDGWKVEAGNVGLHYYHWRYGTTPPDSCPVSDAGFCDFVHALDDAIEERNPTAFTAHVAFDPLTCHPGDEIFIGACGGQPNGTVIYCNRSGVANGSGSCLTRPDYEEGLFPMFQSVYAIVYPADPDVTSELGLDAPLVIVRTEGDPHDDALFASYTDDGWRVEETIGFLPDRGLGEGGLPHDRFIPWP
ncbi:hypothetical protein [Nitrolancea hollandica]|uniref:Uncharacterized protein n=1 Tax=Nitrolancea hollandica Lb TaxID=1129897 RepID=I4EGW5_9BACT|nr:hypothetical protein [Nitrolancea hollandica]CCF83927.1 exported hypothetical protein [Nitrolancea hollandica Lb]